MGFRVEGLGTQRTGKEGRRLRSVLPLRVARQRCISFSPFTILLSSHCLSSYLAFLSLSLIICCQAVGQRAGSVLTLPQVLLHINDEVLHSKCTCHVRGALKDSHALSGQAAACNGMQSQALSRQWQALSAATAWHCLTLTAHRLWRHCLPWPASACESLSFLDSTLIPFTCLQSI